jgi:phenylacetate-CoA ligase
MEWSRRHVPVYAGLPLGKDGSTDVLSLLDLLPIVTRDMLAERPSAYTADVIPRSAYWNRTGGSTGVPLRVLQDDRYHAACMAGKYLFYVWAGWSPSTRILRIWDSYPETVSREPSVRKRFSRWAYDMPELDAYALREGDAGGYLSAIDRLRPSIIESYADAAELLAEHLIEDHAFLRHRPRGLVVSAGTLYPEWRQRMERAFGCPVFNRYGSREAGDIACSRGSNDLFVNPYTHCVEIVDDNGHRVTRGTGRVIVTLLSNRTMPLMRYDIGDYATVESAEALYPASGWQRLQSIDGRRMTMLQGLSPVLLVSCIRRAIRESWFVRQYQVVQRGVDKFTMRIVLRPGRRKEEVAVRNALDGIRTDLMSVLGQQTRLDFEFVDHVEALPSGKVPVCLVRFDTEQEPHG